MASVEATRQLYAACRNGQLETVHALLAAGVANVTGNDGKVMTDDSPLHTAFLCGAFDICALLVEHAVATGVTFRLKATELPLLELAASRLTASRPAMFHSLTRALQLDAHHSTFLLHGCISAPVANFLLVEGADVHARGGDRRTALECMPFSTAAVVLVGAGADVRHFWAFADTQRPHRRWVWEEVLAFAPQAIADGGWGRRRAALTWYMTLHAL